MAKKINPLEKFNKMCDGFSVCEIKLLADILSAMRGPDLDDEMASESLKGYTTVRVRSFIHREFIATGGMISNRFELNEYQIITRNKRLSEGPRHFRNHYTRAIAAIAFLTGYNLWRECQLSEDDWDALRKGDCTVLGPVPEITSSDIRRYLP